MLSGALAMFDALGFKGIWRREGVDPTSVIDKLRHLERTVKESGERTSAEMLAMACLTSFCAVVTARPRRHRAKRRC